jgi:hypothetical protein
MVLPPPPHFDLHLFHNYFLRKNKTTTQVEIFEQIDSNLNCGTCNNFRHLLLILQISLPLGRNTVKSHGLSEVTVSVPKYEQFTVLTRAGNNN